MYTKENQNFIPTPSNKKSQIKNSENDFYINSNNTINTLNTIESKAVERRFTFKNQTEKIEKKSSNRKLIKVPENYNYEIENNYNKNFTTINKTEDIRSKIHMIDSSMANQNKINNIIKTKNQYDNHNYILNDNNNVNNTSNNNVNNLILQRNVPLKNDIDKLDSEIKMLQDKLKFMIEEKN
jgi:hypothetical protein